MKKLGILAVVLVLGACSNNSKEQQVNVEDYGYIEDPRYVDAPEKYADTLRAPNGKPLGPQYAPLEPQKVIKESVKINDEPMYVLEDSGSFLEKHDTSKKIVEESVAIPTKPTVVMEDPDYVPGEIVKSKHVEEITNKNPELLIDDTKIVSEKRQRIVVEDNIQMEQEDVRRSVDRPRQPMKRRIMVEDNVSMERDNIPLENRKYREKPAKKAYIVDTPEGTINLWDETVTPEVYQVIATRTTNKMLGETAYIYDRKPSPRLYIEELRKVQKELPNGFYYSRKVTREIVEGSKTFTVVNSLQDAEYRLEIWVNKIILEKGNAPAIRYSAILYDMQNNKIKDWSEVIQQVQNSDKSWW